MCEIENDMDFEFSAIYLFIHSTFSMNYLDIRIFEKILKVVGISLVFQTIFIKNILF